MLVLTLSCVLIAPTWAPGDPVNFLDPPQGLFSDEWATVELTGKKVGYSHTTMSRQGDTITTRSLVYVKFARAAQAVVISILQSTRETLEGIPVDFDSATQMAAMETKMRGRIDGDQVHITTSQFGVESTQTAKYPSGAKMLWGLYRAGLEHGFKPGTSYELDVYEPSLRTDAALKTKTVVGDRVKIEVHGKILEATKVTSSMALGAISFDTIAYVDADGNVLIGEMSVGGMILRLIVTDKAAALADFEPPEFFLNTLITVDRAIDREKADVIRYTLRLGGTDRRMQDLPTTAMQKPGARTEQSVTVEVRRANVAALKTVEASPPPDDIRKYLRSSPTLNIEDQEIRKMAKEAAGSEKRPYFLADKLRVYVTEVISEKNLNVGFATASEVCRTREGDCSEHAVLLAALGRASGLPSRVVVGLAYVPSFGGKKNVFGFHMWTQFYIGDQWVDFDAALRESDCSPARIALATSPLNTAAIGDIAFSIVNVISGLKVEIDAIETR